MDTLDNIKIKNLYSSKGTIKKGNRQTMEWKMVFVAQ